MSQSLFNLVDNLEELNKNLPDDVLIHRFYNTYNMINDNNIKKFKLLLRKGVYSYECMRSWKNFKEPVPLKKECYYSETNNTNISNDNLEHVKKVCDDFNITNLGDHHDL